MLAIHRRIMVTATLSVSVLLGIAGLIWREELIDWMNPDLMKAGPLGEMTIGDASAPVTIIEYASMSCPHCAAFATNAFPELKARHIDTGRVRFIFREFPLDNLAEAAAMLPRCTADEKFFPTIDLLFAHQRDWRVDEPLKPLLSTAQQANFTEDSFKSCLQNQKILDGIEWVRTRAYKKLKVMSAPTFFINGKMHAGNASIDEIEKLMQQ